jgi:hypothetical protein
VKDREQATMRKPVADCFLSQPGLRSMTFGRLAGKESGPDGTVILNISGGGFRDAHDHVKGKDLRSR